MHISLRRLAQSVSTKPLNLREASATLLPPIPLLRRLLRVHRSLPTEMRILGDDYVKAEFKRHQKTDNPVHIIGFLSQWKMYLDQLEEQANSTGGFERFTGRRLDPTAFEKMTGEQIGQLYELMHASKEVWKPVETLEAEADVNLNNKA
ncbi:complex 1 LYR-like protein [Rhizoctonia solani 123E]|uniref:Succinate dehydrogenase assembly factor 3 n=1 Tax=Rhizoctonia solani 123E TaxID=1423351 RepID=A0A074RU66_9AGAM|nr:complex 1 LYR-like protein [Rhizoctonia solani 123E]